MSPESLELVAEHNHHGLLVAGRHRAELVRLRKVAIDVRLDGHLASSLDTVNIAAVSSSVDRVIKQVVYINAVALDALAHLALDHFVVQTTLEAWVVAVLIGLSDWIVGANHLVGLLALQGSPGWIVEVRTDLNLVCVLEELSHLVVDAVLNLKDGRNAHIILSVHHLEEFFMLETLSVKKTWVTLNLRRPLNLHARAILIHLATHFSHCLSAVLL